MRDGWCVHPVLLRLIRYKDLTVPTQSHTATMSRDIWPADLRHQSTEFYRLSFKNHFSPIEMGDKPSDIWLWNYSCVCFELSDSNQHHLEAPPPSHLLLTRLFRVHWFPVKVDAECFEFIKCEIKSIIVWSHVSKHYRRIWVFNGRCQCLKGKKSNLADWPIRSRIYTGCDNSNILVKCMLRTYEYVYYIFSQFT